MHDSAGGDLTDYVFGNAFSSIDIMAKSSEQCRVVHPARVRAVPLIRWSFALLVLITWHASCPFGGATKWFDSFPLSNVIENTHDWRTRLEKGKAGRKRKRIQWKMCLFYAFISNTLFDSVFTLKVIHIKNIYIVSTFKMTLSYI